MNITRTTVKKWAYEVAIMALIVGAVYGLNKPVQSWMGERALAKVHVDALSFEEAKAQSAVTGKPLLIDFAAIWCSACRKLDQQVFANEKVSQYIADNYIFTRLEYESDDRSIFERYGVAGFPILLIADSSGRPLRQLSTVSNPELFLQQF